MSTTSTETTAVELEPGRPTSRAARRSWALIALMAPLGLVALMALIAPLLPLPDPNAQNLMLRLTPPVWQEGGTWAHALGTDHLGRDMLSRLLHGARLTFLIALSAMFAGATFGTLMGMLAGYKRGWTDTVISRVVDAQLALPVILLALAIIAARGRSIGVLVFVLAIISWAQYARIIRSETLALRERPFVLSLRVGGVPTWRILLQHILPNVGGTVLVLATLEVGAMILAESALSFLGLGVVSPQISWGAMLAEGRDHISQAWWVITFPGVAITTIVLAINLLGDVLRLRYDPRKRRY